MKTKKKKQPATEQAVSPKRQDSVLRNMPMFHRMTNWAELWDEWYLAVDRNGGPKYKYLSVFIEAKAKNEAQHDFMAWFLGPKPKDDEEESPYKWCSMGPQNWVEKRKTGGWFTDSSISTMGKEIRRRMTALEALREAGNGITLHSLVRAEQLAQELDRSFHGKIFLDGDSFDKNVKRARTYLELHSQILSMKEKAQDLYAKSHGVNFEDMSGLTVLVQAANLSGGSIDEGGNRNKAALSAVVEMAMKKSQMYDLELPPGSVEVITDAVTKVDKKKGLQ